MFSQEVIEATKNTKKNLVSRSRKPFPETIEFIKVLEKHEPEMLSKYSLTTIRKLIKNNLRKNVCNHCEKDISEQSGLPKYCNMKCYKSDPKAGEKISIIKSKLYSDPEWKAKTENKKMQSNIKRCGKPHPMQDIDSFEKQKKSSYKKKQYKGVALQGFEPQALEFLSMFEYDIIPGSKYMKESGIRLSYIDEEGKTRYSYPDFFCKDLNAFIEVKSHYTYDVSRHTQIERAIKACKEKAKGYIVMIVSPGKGVSFRQFNLEYTLDPLSHQRILS